MAQACPEECSGTSPAPPPPAPSRPSSPSSSSGPPCNADWSSRTEIRNQGACGDCWTFSTVETLRAAYIQQHNTDPGKLSTQFLVDCMQQTTCSGGVNGCCGGSPAQA